MKQAAMHVGLVIKRTSYQVRVQEHRDAHMLGLLRRRDPAVVPLVASHAEHVRAVEKVTASLKALGVRVTRIRSAHAPFDSSDFDLVVTVGGDGTLLSASHSIGQVPILGINSSPRYSVGFFCAADASQAPRILARAIAGKLPRVELTRMRVKKNGIVCTSRVLNEALFCQSHPAATTRYVMRLGRQEETQKSSGFWIGPAAGSTAAQRSAGGQILPLKSKLLQLVVREPYAPIGKRPKLRHALIRPGATLWVRSRMPDARVFFDGPTLFTEVAFGDELEFSHSAEPLTVLGSPGKRRR